MVHICNFYKQLFHNDMQERMRCLTKLSFPKLSAQQNVSLILSFSNAKIKNAMFSISDLKALKEDGFPTLFFIINEIEI